MNQEKKIKATCPNCKKKCNYDIKNKYRPFCSKSCHDQDLIKWHDEDYRIKGKEATNEEILDELKKDNKEED